MKTYELDASRIFIFSDRPQLIIHLDDVEDFRGREMLLEVGELTIPVRLLGAGLMGEKLALQIEFDESECNSRSLANVKAARLRVGPQNS